MEIFITENNKLQNSIYVNAYGNTETNTSSLVEKCQ